MSLKCKILCAVISVAILVVLFACEKRETAVKTSSPKVQQRTESVNVKIVNNGPYYVKYDQCCCKPDQGEMPIARDLLVA